MIFTNCITKQKCFVLVTTNGLCWDFLFHCLPMLGCFKPINMIHWVTILPVLVTRVTQTIEATKGLSNQIFFLDRCDNKDIHNGLLATLLDEHLAFVVRHLIYM